MISDKKVGRKMNNFKHGFSNGKRRVFYNVWRSMKNRCELKSDSNFERYGKRGIKCFWETFEEFRDDMYESYLEHKKNNVYTSIDRIDVNGNYFKENCKWATREEQSRNTRTNRWLVYKGQKRLLTEWANLLGIKQNTISMRLNNYGWSVDKALNTP